MPVSLLPFKLVTGFVCSMTHDDDDGTQEGRLLDLMQKMEVKPAWDIKTAAEFGAMDGQSKRLCLIKSGAEVSKVATVTTKDNRG